MSIEDLARHGEQIEKLVEELTALRAWKAKARPFLRHYIESCHQNYYDEAVEWAGADSIQAVTIKKTIDELTELLGE